MQAITTLKKKGLAGCLDCQVPGCPGNNLEYDEDTGILKLHLSHHKNERARRAAAAAPLIVELTHPALVKVLAIYDKYARELLHGDRANASGYRFLTREGDEISAKGVLRWHQPIGATRRGANAMVLEVTSRVLQLKPGLT